MSLPPPHGPRRRVVSNTGKRLPAELRAVTVDRDLDGAPDASYLEQEGFEARLASYRRGQLQLLEVHLDAEVQIAETTQVLRSPGVGGIESDVTKEELEPLLQEEWEALRRVLKAVGVPTAELPLNFDPEWWPR